DHRDRHARGADGSQRPLSADGAAADDADRRAGRGAEAVVELDRLGARGLSSPVTVAPPKPSPTAHPHTPPTRCASGTATKPARPASTNSVSPVTISSTVFPRNAAPATPISTPWRQSRPEI